MLIVLTLVAPDLLHFSDYMETLFLLLWANRPKPKIFSTVCCVEPKEKLYIMQFLCLSHILLYGELCMF